MAAKNWRGKSHPGLVWRVLFGNNGPTRARLRAELERKLRLSLSSDFIVPTRDSTGRIQNQKWRIEPDGKVREVKAPAKRKPAAKKTTGRRTASQPSKDSKPSRTSKAGSTQRRQRQPAAAPVQRRSRPEPVSERYLQNPDGTLAGSRKQKPVTYAQAQREAAKAMRNAAAASRHAEKLLE